MPLENDTILPTNELIDSMSFECPYCQSIILRYDKRGEHFIWDCWAYPDAKKRLFFQTGKVRI